MTTNLQREKKMKYVLHPGTVISKSDGDDHYISARQLAELYGVDPRDCVVDGEKTIGMDTSKMIHLGPRYNGDYRESLEKLEANL